MPEDVPVISIVDDDESIRIGTTRLVRSRGFAACGFSSALEFLNSPQLKNTSCVITDFQMPDMNGVRLQLALREGGHTIPVIFITAFPSDKVRAEAMRAGAVCFLEKPFDNETLISCIETALKDRTN